MTDRTANSNISPADQALVVDYLYGDLDAEQITQLESRIQAEPNLAAALKAQQSLEQLMPLNAAPKISQQRLNGVHWGLQKKLRQAAAGNHSIYTRLAGLWQSQVSFKAQFASVLFAFVVGILLAQNAHISPAVEGASPLVADRQGAALQFIKEGDYEITGLKVGQFNRQNGEISVSYSLASQSELAGNIANPQIQQLLTASMQNEVSDSTRLDLVDLLKNQTDSNEVRNALSQSLLNDPNPGVRMAAAEALAKMASDQQVRKALISALKNDVIPGVRVEAFQALSGYLEDQSALDAITNYGTNDSNRFIRQRARELVAKDPISI